MIGIQNLKISSKLSLLIVIVGTGFVVFGVIAYHTVTIAKVGGPLYQKIALENLLVADIVPPDLYLGAEANTQVLGVIVAGDNAEMQAHMADYTTAEKAFGAAIEKYNRNYPPGHNLDLLNGTLRVEALEWFRLMDSEAIPAKMRGDQKAALDIWTHKARPHFEAHRKAVLELLDSVNQEEKATEAAAASTISKNMTVLVGVGFIALVFVVLLGSVISKAITGSLTKTVDVLQEVAQGDLRSRLAVGSKDESGIMANALNWPAPVKSFPPPVSRWAPTPRKPLHRLTWCPPRVSR